MGDQLHTDVGVNHYSARVRRTTHGVAHIDATDWGSLGFGQGYACAADHIDTIADQILKVRSERARYLGPGPADRHVHSDLGYLVLGVGEAAERMESTQPSEIAELVEGYAAGVTHWLATADPLDVPEWCRDAPWVRSIVTTDLFRMYADLALMGSGRNLAEIIGSAQPPGALQPPTPESGPLGDDTPGSNGWALGRTATASGRGMVVANPHFPWYGDGRFWECHLTIPGEIDVYGVALIGCPGVQIGFNESMAWTHTFSRGHRFTVFQLQIDAGSPTRYRHGDSILDMEPSVHSVDVAVADGLERRHVSMWRTHHGPMLNLPMLGWSTTHGFSYRDANLGNDGVIGTFLDMARCHSVGELRSVIRRDGGVPWVNTLAADSAGDAWYSDLSTTPQLSDAADAEYRDRLTTDPITALAASQRIALLDGSDPLFDWTELCAVETLPEWRGDGALFNSNDPYWFAGPGVVLEPAPALCGRHGGALSPRSRMNAQLMSDALREPWDAARAEAELLSNRSLMAEQFLDGVLGAVGSLAGAPDDAVLRRALEVLAAWDRRFDLDSRGAVVWREFLATFSDDELRTGAGLAGVQWTVDDPIDSPAGITSDAEGLARRLRDVMTLLDRLGIAPDVALGDIQFVDRAGRRIPLHGANEVEGIVNVVAPFGAMARSDLAPDPVSYDPVPGRTERTGLHAQGYPITYGASYLMVVEFSDDGPAARGLLAYGQSANPSSVHHIDQVDAFSAKALRPLLFRDREIQADPNLTTIDLFAPRS